MTRKSFVSGAIILMIAGFIVKIFGFIYRIYLSNLIGAEGMGLFQLISPVYSLIILTLTAGISIAVSKMVAEELAKNRAVNVRRITYLAFGLVMFFGLAVSVLMYFFSGFLAKEVLKDERTYYSLILLIPSIPVIAAASALKGYFYGIQEVTPTAISQIVEQIVRIGIVMLSAGYLLKMGLEYACAIAVAGMALGEISNLLVLVLVYKFKKRPKSSHSGKGLIRKRSILIQLCKITIPVSLNRFITSVMAAIEVIMIPQRLIAGGLGYQYSLELYGKLTGMALPLISFPSLVTSSLATTLVPAISEAMSTKSYKSVNYRISKSIQLTLILGFIFTSIFLCYPHQIGKIVYSRQNIGDILFLLAFTCVFIYLQQTLLGILNGLGKQGISLRNSIIGYVIRISFVYFAIPSHGIKGYVLGIVISTALVCLLNIYTITRSTGMAIDINKWFLKPGLVGLLMFAAGKYIYSFFTMWNLGSKLTISLTMMANILISLFLMSLLGVIQKEEILNILGIKRFYGIKKKLI